MARPIWTGSLGFGLVNVPVGLYAATEDHGVHFHQLERGTSDRIRYRRVNERTGEEVPRDRIVRGVDLGTGEYAIVDDEEIEAIAPERSRTIEITDFVDLHRIDPAYFETTYYLAPRGDAAGRAYALLRAAMTQSGKVGIAVFVLRGRERLVAVRPSAAVLAMETMYFADEVRDPAKELPDLPDDTQFGDRELKTACMLIDSLATDWEPTRYESTYRASLHQLIERKRQGETVPVAREPERVAPIVDLMDALNASLEASRRGGGEAPGGAARADGRGGGGGDGQGGGDERSRHRRRTGGSAGRSGPSEARRGSTGRSARARSAASDDLGSMTKAELLSRASELGVAGRSKMSRHELEAAVRRSSRRKAS